MRGIVGLELRNNTIFFVCWDSYFDNLRDIGRILSGDKRNRMMIWVIVGKVDEFEVVGGGEGRRRFGE